MKGLGAEAETVDGWEGSRDGERMIPVASQQGRTTISCVAPLPCVAQDCSQRPVCLFPTLTDCAAVYVSSPNSLYPGDITDKTGISLSSPFFLHTSIFDDTTALVISFAILHSFSHSRPIPFVLYGLQSSTNASPCCAGLAVEAFIPPLSSRFRTASRRPGTHQLGQQ